MSKRLGLGEGEVGRNYPLDKPRQFTGGIGNRKSKKRSVVALVERERGKVRAFFAGVGVTVVTGRLPFDLIEGCNAHNEQMMLVRNVLSLFGGGFAVCVQAVLQACDQGVIEQGEKVICYRVSINEILCKARKLTIARGAPAKAVEQTKNLFEQIPTPLLKAAPAQQPTLIGKGEVLHASEKTKK